MKMISIFPDIPGIDERKVQKMRLCGPGIYQIPVNEVAEQEYWDYLELLEGAGYKKVADNGDGLGGYVYIVNYTKGDFMLSVTYVVKKCQLYITVGHNISLSRHLKPQMDIKRGAQRNSNTKLHMMELWWFGNSFVFQLKNGHFLMSDGGFSEDARYLVEYLETLTPKGEKPVIEAWTITHGHADHCSVMTSFSRDKDLASRICVEGIYFSEPSEEIYRQFVSAVPELSMIKEAAGRLFTTEGEHPNIYRPQTGQRYYFDDITMDIVHCQEQLPLEQYECQDYAGDFNDSSTWYLFTIEGQKILFTGDGDVGSMKVIMETYDSEYLDVDMMTLPHHGFNTWDVFSDYCQVGTLLVTGKDVLPIRREKENAYLKTQVKEWVSGWGDGTKVFTFPYQKGTYETLPVMEWTYHKGVERKEAPSLYTMP